MANTPKIDGAIFSQHALDQMRRRGLTKVQVMAVLNAPEEVQEAREGRIVAQAIDETGLLVRVFVATQAKPPVIVTAYRTSKIATYRGSK